MIRFERMIEIAREAGVPQSDVRGDVLRRIREMRVAEGESSARVLCWFAGGSLGLACLGLVLFMMMGGVESSHGMDALFGVVEPEVLKWVW